MMLFSLSNICGTIRPFTPFDRPDEEMAFAGINDELCRHAERFQSMPKLIRLQRRAFRVAFASDDQGGGLHSL